MSFKDLNLKFEYESPTDNVLLDFYIPALCETVLYKRSSAYFSSSSLLEILPGIRNLYRKNGKIQLILSPQISEEDISAISQGYAEKREIESGDEEKAEIIRQWMQSVFEDPKDLKEKEKYNLLSHLISDGVLDIRVAMMRSNPGTGIFHDKVGILQDQTGNKIAFSGSMNETENALKFNHEHIDVFQFSGMDRERVIRKEQKFDEKWNNQDKSLIVIDFPEDLKAKIKSYERETLNWSILEQQVPKKKIGRPSIPESIELRPYQLQAINKWEQSNFCGIYDMATGTGKTITALASIIRLLDSKDVRRLSIVIVVPYIHLVTQWVADLNRFGIKAIQGFSGSPSKNWKREYKQQIHHLNCGMKKYVCLITTNASFRQAGTQELFGLIQVPSLLVVDEAHNFGTKALLETLDERFCYRLALSATLDRHFDYEGTERLKKYFSPVCISLPLNEAIEMGALCSYEYHPIPVYLTAEELDEYAELSQKISRYIERDRFGRVKRSKGGGLKFRPEATPLLLKRARLVAGAANKMDGLTELMDPLKKQDHILVYCGTTMVNTEGTEFITAVDQELRQVDAVTDLLRNRFLMDTAKYTAEQSLPERGELVQRFTKGDIQALIAIRCLDEGVDIPSVDKAVILASSTNPKEYVQRRGRVLRRSPGKVKSVIYDFVTLPRDLDEPPETNGMFDIGLVKRELERVNDFQSSALNKVETEILKDRIQTKYCAEFARLEKEMGDVEEV